MKEILPLPEPPMLAARYPRVYAKLLAVGFTPLIADRLMEELKRGGPYASWWICAARQVKEKPDDLVT